MDQVLFATLRKVDEENRLVYGRAAEEVPDRSDEIFDYETSKPYFKAWSDEVAKDTNGKSLGNVRAMHGKVAAGKLTEITFDDAGKAVDVVSKIVDDGEWKKVMEGVYSGFSIGGSYVGDKKVEKMGGKDIKRYTAKPSEISLVDRPCIPTAKFFEVRKADGSVIQKAFTSTEDKAMKDFHVKLSEGSTDEEKGMLSDAQKHLDDSDGLTKGDFPGHPFRGNQHTSGESGKAVDASMKAHGHETKESHSKAASAHRVAAKVAKEKGHAKTAAYHETMAKFHDSRAGRAEKMENIQEIEAKSRELAKADGADPDGKHTNESGVEVPMWQTYQKQAIEVLAKGEGHQTEQQDKTATGTDGGDQNLEVSGTPEQLAEMAKVMREFKIDIGGATEILVKHLDPYKPDIKAVEVAAKVLAKAAGTPSVWTGFIKQAETDLRKIAERKDTNPDTGTSKYGDVTFADETNKKYPIDTEEHIRAAWNYINKAKNAGKYSGGDLAKIKGKIVAAWKSKIDKEGPPSVSEKDFTPTELRKNLSTCSSFIYCLDTLTKLQDSVEYEAYIEADDSLIPDKLREVIKSLGDVVVEMLQEELSEEYEGENQATNNDLRNRVMGLADQAKGLQKRATDNFRKFGRRNSADDQGRIQRMHDMSVELGAECGNGGIESAAQIAGLAKSLGIPAEKTKEFATVVAAMIKQHGKDPTLEKVVAENAELKKSMEALTDKLDKVLASPRPATVTLRAIPKSADTGNTEPIEKTLGINPVVDSEGKERPAATLLKLIHQYGGQPLVYQPPHDAG